MWGINCVAPSEFQRDTSSQLPQVFWKISHLCPSSSRWEEPFSSVSPQQEGRVAWRDTYLMCRHEEDEKICSGVRGNMRKLHLKWVAPPLGHLQAEAWLVVFTHSSHGYLLWHRKQGPSRDWIKISGFAHKKKMKWKCLSRGWRGQDLLRLLRVFESAAS